MELIEIDLKWRNSKQQQLDQIPKAETSIRKVSGEISYVDFFNEFMQPNIPCIFKSEIVDKWRSKTDWVDDRGKPNFDFLAKTFGDSVAPVANCSQQYFNAQKKDDMRVNKFIEYWKKYIQDGYPTSEQCLYLKDWHFSRNFPEYDAYKCPEIFSSDWLNEYWSAKGGDDYKFVYMGPKGSWTPLHVDVFTSFSWSANVCGQKRWILFPPGTEKKLKNKLGDLPNQRELSDDLLKEGIVADQFAGETIFVPSGWHHQVWNVEDTISINHNWLNGCCVRNSWLSLEQGLKSVEKELADCSDMDAWSEQCQLVLKAVAGIDFKEFLDFLLFIARQRIICLDGESPLSAGNTLLGKEHAYFDLSKIVDVLELFYKITPNPDCDNGLQLIKEVLGKYPSS
ncbi:2-oxoglutarate and iron-dependent oxygenase JMJD4 [Neocloeon triangulifer]|uniref:2-oxoglutarate and iron-dependent oxygenase JMJD4 n=1 Tax=Neocloeon triangulifer TaxID=2078957 RepID=UPI00286F931B|nr:2-oxoglutarate and iron-dependent oxygenase JMJD4 [Neocloeon triangulifer]